MHGQPRVEMERVRPPVCPSVPIMLSAGLLCQWKISHGKLGREGSPAPEHRPFPLGQNQLPWGWSLSQGLAVLPRMFTVKGFSWTTSPCLCPASSLSPHRHPTYFSFFWGIKCIHSFNKQLATTYCIQDQILVNHTSTWFRWICLKSWLHYLLAFCLDASLYPPVKVCRCSKSTSLIVL